MRDSVDGQKGVYYCKYPGCKNKCYKLFTAENETVSVWFNDLEHIIHDENTLKATDLGMNRITKLEIDKLYAGKVHFPSSILSSLRKMSEKFEIVNGKESDICNPTYVEGIKMPSKQQVYNYVNNTLEQKVVKTKFSYGDLAEWVESHRDVPDIIYN
jgi:hypothetical protein